MKSRILAILNRKHYFNVVSSMDDTLVYTLEPPAQLLMKNIHLNWLRYLHNKTQKSFPVFIQNSYEITQATKPPFGILNNNVDYKGAIFKQNLNEYKPDKNHSLSFSIILPQQDLVQYFIQWQRYRKYWWSSITTTPSLFGIDDVKQGETEANVDIVARLPSGPQPVELITMKSDHTFENCCCLSCTMSLEGALLMLLLDGSNDSDDDYLRLHRKIAPYKISFALSFQDSSNELTLKELATLLYNRLKLENISAWLPDFSMGIEDQVRENLNRGVTYTAILSEGTLDTGILHLLNSSTLLKEQLHVADFHTYSKLICNDR